MKNLLVLSLCLSIGISAINAENMVATLEHQGKTNVYYGLTALVEAYNSSANGDTIYLSSGQFTAPTEIAKGICIFGAGHFPIEGRQTTISQGFSVKNGADNLQIEGVKINGDISFDGTSTINYVRIIRCTLVSVHYNSTKAASKSHCSIEECFISNIIYFGSISNGGGDYFLLRNSVSGYNIQNIAANAMIDGNVFLINDLSSAYGSPFVNIENSIIQNNICLAEKNIIYNPFGNCINQFTNNLFVASTHAKINSATNYFGVAKDEIFISQTGNAINYLHDYHLKKPELYKGTDGKEVGIYGGISFKEQGIPSNPYIQSRNISTSTDPEGNLQLNITVIAQEN